ncbi:hypothetical protein AM501_26005 [Aneurinibacillus migulanus]|uniref:hypothetical protein n=1 Tax=Aneurinibacillus migulanus TaxID=47500 RepID=UPI0005BE4BF3|nr:hypothetical protein [Aneurinibacillus migulanus]KIV57628.1 hypothetical protein TS64_06370 [Aneurinibacillus migulanus]KPD05501.1 hypothetical protein AM501_26005 [Aneurinibacillus migulanus]MCP1357657.1 hypothetical protein [Aneurinibacillus migulanus]
MKRSFRKAIRAKKFRKQKFLKEWEDKKANEIIQKISSDLEENLTAIRSIFRESDDLIIRRFMIGAN